MTREQLGRLVRQTWVQWASKQPDPKPSWLLPWDELEGSQREADMRIGEAVAAAERDRLLAALREFLPQYVGLVIRFRTPDGNPVYASGPVAFGDALVNTFAIVDSAAEMRRLLDGDTDGT